MKISETIAVYKGCSLGEIGLMGLFGLLIGGVLGVILIDIKGIILALFTSLVSIMLIAPNIQRFKRNKLRHYYTKLTVKLLFKKEITKYHSYATH